MYRFYGQLEQDKFIFERYFPTKNNGISIECGAFDGKMESATFFFEETLDWTCINIESSPPIFDSLISNREKSLNFNFGLGNTEEVLQFKHAIHPELGLNFGNGSFSHKENHLNILNMEGCKFIDYDVKITTYKKLIDGLMNEKFPDKIIDLFVLDVEGFELQVIDGMLESKFLPKVFCIEFPHVGLDTLIEKVGRLGYSFDVCYHNNAFFIKN